MKPLSLDLRERIVNALEHETSSLIVAARFDVSGSVVRKLRLKVERTGSIEPVPIPGRERLIAGADEDHLAELVREHPDATLKVLCELLEAEAGIVVSETTMWRQLKRMDITLKKTLHATERDRPDVVEARQRFFRRMLWWHNRSLVFIDESGVNLSQTRAEGRAPRGQRLVDAVPGGRWENYTIIAGLRESGIIAPMMLPGAMNSERLRTWVRKSLAPALKRGDIVVWDNLSIHNDSQVAALIEQRGATLEFLPAYSPDLNPIERAWSKMKTILRKLKARTRDALTNALGTALHAITKQDCLGWFKHSGYTLP